jgi:hypothetical protein
MTALLINFHMWEVNNSNTRWTDTSTRPPMKISCYPPLRTMLWVLCIISMSVFYTICGCIVEERIALIHIRSTLEKRYTVPASWKQSDNCCSWERIRCNNSTRALDLNFSKMTVNSTTGGGCWNLNMTIFSAFHELQLLDLSYNQACLQSFDGNLLLSM